MELSLVVRTAWRMMADVDCSHAMTSSESLSRLTLSHIREIR